MYKVTVAQIKPALGNLEKNKEKHFTLIEQAIETKSDIIVFPELSLTGYFLRDLVNETALSKNSDLLKELKKYSRYISIVAGGVYEDENYLIYNAGFYFENGELKNIHKKVYLPDYTMFEEGRYFTAGDNFTVFETNGLKSAILICEDALQVSSIYAMKLQKVEIIYVISNSPARGLKEDKFYSQDFWYTALKYMALSCNAYVVFVNRVGVEEGVAFWGGSTLFSPMGDIVKNFELFEERVETARLHKDELRRSRIISPFLKDDKADIIKKLLK